MPLSRYLFAVLCLLLVAACDNGSPSDQPGDEQMAALSPPEQPCGNPILVDVQDLRGNSMGVMEVLNDDQHLWLIYSPNLSNRLFRANLYIGLEEELPRDRNGNDLMSEFPIRLENLEEKIVWSHHFRLDSLPPCFVVAICLQTVPRELEGPVPGQISFAWARGNRPSLGPHSVVYCPRSCDPTVSECTNGTEPGEFTTFTAAGWARALEEEGWQSYLDSLFPRAFPEGLQLGCEHHLTFSGPGALRAFLPGTGTGKVLEMSVQDPQGLENGLAAEVCALRLTLGLDRADEDFCKSPAGLSTLLVGIGPFAGWNVTDLLEEANTVLGGCASNYTAGQMEEVIRQINHNFSGGDIDGGFLRCAGE